MFFSDAQIETLTDAQLRQLLIHNETGERLCGWEGAE